MNIAGERSLAVPVAEVWAKLFDPAVLQQCIPGCESLTLENGSEYAACVVITIGPIKAKFNGKLHIRDAVEPERCTLVFEGAGGAAGMVKGSAQVSLSPSETGTTLKYDADAQIAGKLAQIGSRLVESVARKLADQFFTRFEAQIAAPEGQAAK